jgi:hypothetical protein
MWAEGQASQALVVSFWAAFTLEASLPPTAAGPSEHCGLYARQVPTHSSGLPSLYTWKQQMSKPWGVSQVCQGRGSNRVLRSALGVYGAGARKTGTLCASL